MFRFLFFPIATIFSIIIFIRNLAFDLKILKITKVSKPVISIGNITTGGTGKTPIAILFANEAKKRGLKPGILSRGYQRKSSGSLVVHDGIKLLLSVTDSGDEPFLMANKLKNVPIIVDANRINGANRLIKDFGVDIVILDDGFQHRYLYRDIDLLLINASVKADMYQMLPLGMLRELPTSISRASKVLISKGSFGKGNNHVPGAEVPHVYEAMPFYACILVCMYPCMHVCMYPYMLVCMYACTLVCMYACTFVLQH